MDRHLLRPAASVPQRMGSARCSSSTPRTGSESSPMHHSADWIVREPGRKLKEQSLRRSDRTAVLTGVVWCVADNLAAEIGIELNSNLPAGDISQQV